MIKDLSTKYGKFINGNAYEHRYCYGEGYIK